MAAKRREQKAETAQRIFEVAVGLFLSRGYEATTVAAITAAAGVAKGTFFLHFPSKEAVLGQLGHIQVARLEAAIASRSDLAALPFAEQVRLMYHTLGAGIEGQRDMVRLVTAAILNSSNSNQLLTGIEAFDGILLPLVQAGQAQGVLRADYPAAHLAAVVRGTYFMAVYEWLRNPPEPFVGVADRYLDLLLAGVLARNPAQ